jgi:hypothetical protein
MLLLYVPVSTNTNPFGRFTQHKISASYNKLVSAANVTRNSEIRMTTILIPLLDENYEVTLFS